VSVDPSNFQGYTQPAPITITLAGPVGSVSVTGQGAIKCSGATYGTIVGYDSTGAELGRVDLSLIDPADCSPPDNPDDVTFGASGTLVTLQPMTRAVILPMSPLEFPVFDLTGHASATYSISVDLTNAAAIKLTCSGPVQRGAGISCTAATVDPSKSLTVTAWSFTDMVGHTLDGPTGTPPNPWSGTLVTNGNVSVQATVDGAQASASATVNATPRNWTGKLTLKNHSVVTPDTLSSRPTGIEGTGNTDLSLPLDPGVARWLQVISDGGPNNGFAYLLDLPPVTTSRSQIASNAMNDTSGFYRIQETRTKVISGVTYCGKSVVTGVLPGLTTEHEGAVANPDQYPNSHPGIFRHHVDSVAYARFEPILSFGSEDNVTPANAAILSEAAADSKAMDTDFRNYVNNVSLGCQTFHFDYSKLK
jgi:hypothetical protein